MKRADLKESTRASVIGAKGTRIPGTQGPYSGHMGSAAWRAGGAMVGSLEVLRQ